MLENEIEKALVDNELTPKSWTQNQLRGGQFFHDKI